jgi:hypothetical protein
MTRKLLFIAIAVTILLAFALVLIAQANGAIGGG